MKLFSMGKTPSLNDSWETRKTTALCLSVLSSVSFGMLFSFKVCGLDGNFCFVVDDRMVV